MRPHNSRRSNAIAQATAIAHAIAITSAIEITSATAIHPHTTTTPTEKPMPQSLAKIYIHLIFSTKNREANVLPRLKDKLYAYMAGTLNAMRCPCLAIGGMADHAHFLFLLGRDMKLSDVVMSLKTHSTKWYKEQLRCNFAWQNGYAAFSVSQSMVDKTRTYILTQPEHHAKHTFEEEYTAFLKNYGLTYDEAYVWD